MADNEGGDKYDPEAERCCKDCGKTFKSKEGVLHDRYEFHCSPCHMWGKKTGQKIYIGGGIFLVIVIIMGLIWLTSGLKKGEKKRKRYSKCKYYNKDGKLVEEYDDDDDD